MDIGRTTSWEKCDLARNRSAAAPAVVQTSPIAFLRGKMTTSFPTQVCRPQMSHLIAKSASKMIVCLVCKRAMVLRGAHIPLLRQRGSDLISPNFKNQIDLNTRLHFVRGCLGQGQVFVSPPSPSSSSSSPAHPLFFSRKPQKLFGPEKTFLQ